MSESGHRHRPSTPVPTKDGPEAQERQFVGGSVQADLEWARNRIRNHFAANKLPNPLSAPRSHSAAVVQRSVADAGPVSKREPAVEEAGAVASSAAEAVNGTTQESAAPNRKPDDVGRKVFLARDNSKTDASIKRLGRAGQDKDALKDALKRVQFERASCVEALTALRNDVTGLGLSSPQAEGLRASVDTGLNSIRDHLTDDDIAGAMRDAASDPVRQPGSGKTFDHLDEVNSAVAALQGTRNVVLRVRRDLSRRQIDPKIASGILDPALNGLQRVVQSVEDAIRKVKP